MRKTNTKSLGMLTVSMILFGSIGVFRRYMPLPSATLAFFRGVLGALFLFLAAKAQKKKPECPLKIKTLLWLIFTGAMMGLNWILLFESYRTTTVSTATLCYYMQPAIVILLSPIVFGEKLTVKKGLCAILSLVGMGFVSGVVENGIPPVSELKGILFGIGAAGLYAAVVIFNKKLPGVDVYEKTIIQLLAAAVILIPALVLGKQPILGEWNAAIAIKLLIVGIVHTGIAYALYFGSMDGLKAQTVAMMSYLDPIVALVLAALVLREQMTIYGAVGAVLIIGAAILSEVNLKKE